MKLSNCATKLSSTGSPSILACNTNAWYCHASASTREGWYRPGLSAPRSWRRLRRSAACSVHMVASSPPSSSCFVS